VLEKVQVIYLGGLGRSGSTLLERLLAELPGVCAAGEVVHMWQRGVAGNERCGCGRQFGDCAFWEQVGNEAFGGWQNVSPARIAGLRESVDRTRFIPLLAVRRPLTHTRQNLAEYTDYYLRVYRAIGAVSGCASVIDSSKHASLAFCLSHRPEVDLRVIHVVRDSRAVAYSWMTKIARPDASGESFMTRYPPARAAGQWNMQNWALQVLARRGTPVLRIRYEDLVAAPQQTLAAAARFAGVRFGQTDLGFLGTQDDVPCATLQEAHTASGNPMRFAKGAVTIRGDERWRSAMPQADRRTVTAMTLPLLSHYGYVGRAA
jgi:Sulfotransferase domain